MTTDKNVANESTHFRNMGRVPRFTATWLRYVLGFSVSVAVGLAPYLGKVKVPLFTPMLSLIPESLQDIALPLSSASMGIVAVVVQWYASQKLGPMQTHRLFVRIATACVMTLLVFSAIEVLCVVRIEVPAVDGTVTFAIGPIHPHKPPCEKGSRAECITQKLKTLNETKIESYFGEVQGNVAKLLLVIAYTAFMSLFGTMVGLTVLTRTALKMGSNSA
jgi:hypothetical protein